MIIKIEEDENGLFIVLPDEIIKQYDLKDGDDVEMEVADDHKSFFISFPKDKNGNT